MYRLWINSYIECEILHKITDSEGSQKQSSTSSVECITQLQCHNIISILLCNVYIACMSKICRVKRQWLLEAKIGTYKLYDKSFLTLLLKKDGFQMM